MLSTYPQSPPTDALFRFRPQGFALGLFEISLSTGHPPRATMRQCLDYDYPARCADVCACMRMPARDAVRARARAGVRRVRVSPCNFVSLGTRWLCAAMTVSIALCDGRLRLHAFVHALGDRKSFRATYLFIRRSRSFFVYSPPLPRLTAVRLSGGPQLR